MLLTGSVLIVIAAAIFFLPMIPVRVQSYCIACAGVPFGEHGYSSVGLYFFNYGGIYTIAEPNFPNPPYVGYCLAYGNPNHTSCGLGIDLLKD
jgi:hypothetical protein